MLDLLAAVRRVLGAEVPVQPGTDPIATTQFLALRALAVRERTASELAGALGVRLPTLTQLADGLVAKGWILRHDDPDDRRRVRLTLTDTGTEIYRSARERAEERMDHLLAFMSADERTALIDGLEALRTAIISSRTASPAPNGGPGSP